ncbi:MAG: sortase [Chloroflexota bacterium]|nr:sortase [Chloroflexota bacterium]
MQRSLDALGSRILPAALTALGVAFVTVGLISVTGPVEAEPGASPDPTTTVRSSPSASSSLPASVPPSLDPSPTIPADRVATRLRVVALGIDLPVIAQPDLSFVPCGVAMYLGDMRQPGAARATYLYAHAQRGMFLSILEASRVNNGFGMIGDIAEVYTSDDMLFLYEIDKVIRHVPYDTGLDDAVAATSDELWLQTSEGIGSTFPKLQIRGAPLSSGPADPAKAHPTAKPRRCP